MGSSTDNEQETLLFDQFVASLESDEAKLRDYVVALKDFNLSNGLVFLSKGSETRLHDQAIPLPVTLYPTKFPANEFYYAMELQAHVNELTHLISIDHEFLKEALKNVVKVDEFTRRLWEIYETVRNEGIVQPISFGILRNDFMLDQNKTGNEQQLTCLSQIEINTVSASFGSATTNVNRLHKYLLNYTNYGNLASNHPDNKNLTFLANGMVKAWEQYGNSKAVIVFVVTENETNIGDQRLLEYKCIELNSSVRILRYTLSDCFSLASLDSDKRLIIKDQEVGLVYYRAGYDPKHYVSEKDWSARILIERSRAIKCPNIQLHITGAKIVQQVLSEPATVERFIKNKDVVDRLRATFVDIHAINKENLSQILQIIEDKCHEYVLKPQREGGGNNIYKEDIKNFVNSLSDKSELMGYILMKLVRPNISDNYLIRGDSNPTKKKVISELGIYGVYLANNDEFILNETGGYLLRTKSYETNEGGVASGFSALDSIYLV